METTATIINITLIVMGVLQIILFFKIWGMTNDVKDLRNKIDSRDLTMEQLAKKIIELKFTGKIEEAKKLLDENLKDDVFNKVLVKEVSMRIRELDVELVIGRYKKLYQLLNCEMPKEIINIDLEKIVNEYSSL